MKKFLVLIVSAMLIQPNILFAAEGKKMTRSDICKKNYEKLFNSDWNPNVGSDPEMMAILQKYIFGEVFTVGNLDMKMREMLTVTSLAVQQTLPQLKAHINAALNVGVTPLEVRESLYQCAPFIGFPKTLNAIGVMNEVFKERVLKPLLKWQGLLMKNLVMKKALLFKNHSMEMKFLRLWKVFLKVWEMMFPDF